MFKFEAPGSKQHTWHLDQPFHCPGTHVSILCVFNTSFSCFSCCSDCISSCCSYERQYYQRQMCVASYLRYIYISPKVCQKIQHLILTFNSISFCVILFYFNSYLFYDHNALVLCVQMCMYVTLQNFRIRMCCMSSLHDGCQLPPQDHMFFLFYGIFSCLNCSSDMWFTFVFNLCFIVSGSYTMENHIVIHQNEVVKTYSFIQDKS